MTGQHTAVLVAVIRVSGVFNVPDFLWGLENQKILAETKRGYALFKFKAFPSSEFVSLSSVILA
jgi:hypothetical protein